MILHEPTFKVLRSTHKSYLDGAFLVVDPLIYAWEDKRCVITVPSGTITNFASVPTGLRNVFPINGKHRLAAVAHDSLYGHGGVIQVSTILGIRGMPIETFEPVKIYYTRAEADLIFLQLMLVEGVRKSKARAMYRAVRWFGKSSWNGE